MNNIKTKFSDFLNEDYEVGDQLKSKSNYMDLTRKGETYEISSKENNLGTDMFYIKDKNGRVVNKGWGLKKFELDIQFQKI